MNRQTNRKLAVLEAAERVRHTQIYVPSTTEYVEGFASMPVGSPNTNPRWNPLLTPRARIQLTRR